MVSTQEKVQIKTPEFVSLQFSLAGLGSRAVALIIDQLILIVINIALFSTLIFGGDGFETFFSLFGVPYLAIAITLIVVFAINIGYFIVFEYYMGGQTIGKKVSGIRVIQDTGHSITLLGSFIRNLLRIIDMLPASYLIGMIMIFFHSEHKRLGDLAAGTLVIVERKHKKTNKLSPIERVLSARNITTDSLPIDDSSLSSIGSKEWQLLKKYCDRFAQLPEMQRTELTTEMANILFTKIDVSIKDKSNQDLENMLLALYVRLKDDFDYEL